MEQNNPLQPNPERMLQILSGKLTNEQMLSSQLQSQLENVTGYAQELEKKIVELEEKCKDCKLEDKEEQE